MIADANRIPNGAVWSNDALLAHNCVFSDRGECSDTCGLGYLRSRSNRGGRMNAGFMLRLRIKTRERTNKSNARVADSNTCPASVFAELFRYQETPGARRSGQRQRFVIGNEG